MQRTRSHSNHKPPTGRYRLALHRGRWVVEEGDVAAECPDGKDTRAEERVYTKTETPMLRHVANADVHE
jgi:type IV secretory pathway protease TraF